MTNTKLVSLDSVMDILKAQESYSLRPSVHHEYHRAVLEIKEAIQQLQIQEAQEWVDVLERLPEQKYFYTGTKIAYYKENYVIAVSSPNASIQCIESCIGFRPTHWCELPQHPTKQPEITVSDYIKKPPRPY